MRHYHILDQASIEGELMTLTSGNTGMEYTRVTMKREGNHLAIATSLGALELAFRLNYEELQRKTRVLKPIPGLATTRQVGGVQAYISLGMTEAGGWVLRPTLVSDATGHLTLNLCTTAEVFQQVRAWLKLDEENA